MTHTPSPDLTSSAEDAAAHPDAASAVELRRHLLRAGIPGRRVLTELATIAAAPDVQRHWAEWASVRDRDELVLRLEVLARTAHLEPALVEPLLFFFRASDPGLYQYAALTIGKHLRGHSELASGFREYAEARGHGPDGPVAFPGGRSARRALLVRARAPGPGNGVAAFPETIEGVRGRADLAVIVLAVDWAVRDGGAGSVAPIVGPLIARVLEDPELAWDRALTARLGDLLLTLHDHGARTTDEVLETLSGALARLAEGEEPASAGEAVARLRCIDELTRVFGSLGVEESRVVGMLPETGHIRPGFVAGRARTWQAFLSSGLPAGLAERRRIRRVLTRALRALGEPSAWLYPPPEDRAEIFFHLLDPLLELRHDPDDVGDLLAATFPQADARRASRELGEGRGPVAWLLPRFLELEGPPGIGVVDPGLVHRLDTDGLVRVLATNPDPGLAPVFADALEHRLRLALAADAEFDPEALLLRVAAARPAPEVWRAFADLVRDRTYEGTDGRHFPLGDWVRALSVERQPTSRGDLTIEAWGRTGRLRHALRDGLARIAGEDDLHDRLLQLASLLAGGAGGERFEEGMEGPVQPLVQRIQPRVDLLPFDAVAAAFTRIAVGLRPQRVADVGRTRGLLHEIRGDAIRVADAALAALPPPEGESLSSSIRRAVGDAEDVVRAFTFLEERVEEGWDVRQERDALLEHFLVLQDPRVRIAGLELLWRELSAEVGLDPGVPGQSNWSAAEWNRAEEMLSWAVRVSGSMEDEVGRAWRTEVSAGWVALAEDAMEAGHAGRLSRLVGRREVSAVAAREDNGRFLDGVRRWLLDAYRPRDAARAVHLTRTAAGGKGRAPTWLRAAPLFLGHYGSVWLALLIGGILMLDFGDAWTTMAEVGDVRGIAYTVALGLGGAFAYITVDLRRRVRPAPEDSVWWALGGTVLRASLFLTLALIYTALLTTGLWFLLSGTDEVVHGEGAVLHIAVWTGFALFIGVFFGLLAKRSH